MVNFASSVINAQSTKQKFINVGATGSTTYMSIRASTATEKSRYANSYDVLTKLASFSDDNYKTLLQELNTILDEQLDFYPTLSIVSDARGIGINFIIQISCNVTFRGAGQTRVNPTWISPTDPSTDTVAQYYGKFQEWVTK